MKAAVFWTSRGIDQKKNARLQFLIYFKLVSCAFTDPYKYDINNNIDKEERVKKKENTFFVCGC